MAAVPLMAKRLSLAGCEGGERRKDTGETVADVVVEPDEPVALQALEVIVERINEQPKGEIAFQLRSRPREHEMAPCVGAARKLQ